MAYAVTLKFSKLGDFNLYTKYLLDEDGTIARFEDRDEAEDVAKHRSGGEVVEYPES